MNLDTAVRNALMAIGSDESSDGFMMALKTDAKNNDDVKAIAEELVRLECLDKGYIIAGHSIQGQTHKGKAIDLLEKGVEVR